MFDEKESRYTKSSQRNLSKVISTGKAVIFAYSFCPNSNKASKLLSNLIINTEIKYIDRDSEILINREIKNELDHYSELNLF